MSVKLRRHKDQWASVHINSNNKGTLEDLIMKYITPVSFRVYDRPKGVWTVHYSRIPTLISLCTRYKETIDTSELGQWKTASKKKVPLILQRKKEETPLGILYLTEEAPGWLVKEVFEKLVLAYHPDTGGDTADAVRLQEVYEAYQKIKEDQ